MLSMWCPNMIYMLKYEYENKYVEYLKKRYGKKRVESFLNK